MTERFPDKKVSSVNFRESLALIKAAQHLNVEADVGQENANWLVTGEYPDLPIMFLWMTDLHYGSLGTDHDLAVKHLGIVEETPNTYVIFGGDIVDNFSAAKHPQAGIATQTMSPQMQTTSILDEISFLDKKGKVGAMVYGNHDDFITMAGYDYYQTFMQELEAPVFDRGGVLHTHVNGGQRYDIGLGHKFWGTSKLNPENAGRRFMEFGTNQELDIVLLGDDHQAAGSMFDRGGVQKIVVDGGTYQTMGKQGKKWGLGAAGEGGYTIMLWGQEQRMQLYRDPIVAQQVMLALVFEKELQ